MCPGSTKLGSICYRLRPVSTAEPGDVLEQVTPSKATLLAWATRKSLAPQQRCKSKWPPFSKQRVRPGDQYCYEIVACLNF